MVRRGCKVVHLKQCMVVCALYMHPLMQYTHAPTSTRGHILTHTSHHLSQLNLHEIAAAGADVSIGNSGDPLEGE